MHYLHVLELLFLIVYNPHGPFFLLNSDWLFTFNGQQYIEAYFIFKVLQLQIYMLFYLSKLLVSSTCVAEDMRMTTDLRVYHSRRSPKIQHFSMYLCMYVIVCMYVCMRSILYQYE